MKRILAGILGSLFATVACGGYTPLAYLEATGSQWIHTGYTPNCTDRVETKVRFTSVGGFVFCARAGGGANSYSCVIVNGKFRLDHAVSAQTYTSTAIAANTDYSLVVNGATGAATLNHATSLGTVSTAAYQPAGPFALFAAHEQGSDLKPSSTMVNFVQGRMYYFRVYDRDGNLVRDFIPVRDDDAAEDSLQRYGMFETVTGVFHPNCGTRAFTPGPEVGPEPHRMLRRIAVTEVAVESNAMRASLSLSNPGCAQRLFVAWGDADGGSATNGWAHVEALPDVGIWEVTRTVAVSAGGAYLRFFAQPIIPEAKMVEKLTSSGANEYVDTGFMPDSNSSAEFRFKMLIGPNGSLATPFGSRNGGNNQFLVMSKTVNSWYYRFGNKAIDNATVGNPGVQGEHCFLLDRNIYVCDGVARTLTMNEFSKANNLYVFALNDNNAACKFAPIDFYSLSLWDDGVLARAYVPCVKDDGTPALYDSVTGRFDVNNGATSLTAGAEAWSVSDLQAVNLTIPVRAEWTGKGTAGDLADFKNWTCWNLLDEVLEEMTPTADTEITVKGVTTFSWPSGQTLACKSIAFDCALDADANWLGLDSSRVVPGAKIDLAGHKLDVAELAFEGTITGKEDLTEPIAANVSSSSSFAYSAASYAFSDNFTWNDGSGRIMVAQSNLPMELVYDFGEGNAKTVRGYRLYGNGPASAGRMPKNWTMQGSNDRLNWTLLDTRTEETGWTYDDNVRTYSFDNSAPYRYYRMEFTATQAPDAAYLSFAQLEFFDGPVPVSELHVVVPEGVVAVNSTVKLNGSLKLVKEGAGILRPAMSRQYYTGGTEVAEGTLQAGLSGAEPFGYGIVWVLQNGTFDTNGKTEFHRMHFILDGGTLVNTTGNVSVTEKTFGWVTLARNSQVGSVGAMGGWHQYYDAPVLNLNGFTLDVAAESGNIQFRGPETITNGTIRVYGGLTTYNAAIEAGTVDFEFFKTLILHVPITVRNLTLHDTIESISPISGTILVKGTFTPETTKFPKVQLLEGSTFNLKTATEAWPTTGDIAGGNITFAENAHVALELGTRPLRSGQKVLTWNEDEAPENIDTVHFHVKDRNYGTTVGDDGLYLFSNAMVIIVR